MRRTLAVLVAVSFVIFIPMFRFSVDYPNHFWMRTAGRLLGDEVIQETDAAGNIYERNATIEERLSAFQGNLPVLTSNIRNALLMYNWKGDVAWINAAPNRPASTSSDSTPFWSAMSSVPGPTSGARLSRIPAV